MAHKCHHTDEIEDSNEDMCHVGKLFPVVEAFVVARGKFCLSSQQGVVRINGRGEQL